MDRAVGVEILANRLIAVVDAVGRGVPRAGDMDRGEPAAPVAQEAAERVRAIRAIVGVLELATWPRSLMSMSPVNPAPGTSIGVNRPRLSRRKPRWPQPASPRERSSL